MQLVEKSDDSCISKRKLSQIFNSRWRSNISHWFLVLCGMEHGQIGGPREREREWQFLSSRSLDHSFSVSEGLLDGYYEYFLSCLL